MNGTVSESMVLDRSRVNRRRVTAAAGESQELPQDLIDQSAKRLAIFAMLTGGTTLFVFLLYNLVWPDIADNFGRATSLSLVVVSAVLAVKVHKRVIPERRLAVVGLAYLIAVCLAVSLIEHHHNPLGQRPRGTVSWACLALLIFPSLVVTKPKRVLLGCLLAASMNPAAFFVTEALREQGSASVVAQFAAFWPIYLSAVVAYIGTRVVNQMGHEVRQARELGSYQLVELLGRGGMGEVWLARHQMLARPAAVKLIRPDALGAVDTQSTAQLKVRFEREAQATAQLESPHTVELYDFGVAGDGTFYYAMELLRGIDLETLIDRFGPVPAERAVHFLRQACDSLDDAHRRGLIHRDIKPANIFLSRRGRYHDIVKVMDFGLVKVEGTASFGVSTTATRVGEFPGTPAYLAPELVNEEEVDFRMDLYALGCVAYWLLTGRLVFDAKSPMKMAMSHAMERPEPPSQHTELPIPDELERIIMACLEKSPADRPQTAFELGEQLAAIALEREWNEERAERWWQTHLPEIESSGFASSVTNPSAS